MPPARTSTGRSDVSDSNESAGAIIQALISPAGRADPFPLYAAAHRIGPVLAVTDSVFIVVGYAAANQVLRNPGFGLPSSPMVSQTAGAALRLMERSILRTNPPDHGRMRSLISQVFTPRRVAELQPSIEAAVGLLVDRLAESAAGGRAVDFMDQFAFQLPVTVICELLGIPAADRDQFRPLASALTAALELAGNTDDPADTGLPPDTDRPANTNGSTDTGLPADMHGPADAVLSADAAARELGRYFTPLIGERRRAPGDDLVSALVAARDAEDGRLSDEELLANLILLLVAGFETTTDLLGNGLTILLNRPDLRSGLRTGRIMTADFIEEVLRYESPVQVTTRVAHADGLVVDDVPVPVGSDVLLLLGAANRDPARYPDPDRFDPSRAGNKPLSFGAGAHICLGNNLARLEAAVAFPKLVERLPGITAGGEPTRRDRLVLRGYQTLPIRIRA